jgi:diguanylate cyclase (GGDEF)-like protein/PAS domain S-box-containing protein
MGGVAVPFSNSVGLLLRSDEERQVVRSVALDIGLEPVDLTVQSEGTALALSEAVLGGLQLIVTDGEWIAVSSHPLVIQVRDEVQADETGHAWILHRPLREATVRAQLRQAAYANRIFIDRNRSVFEQLQRSRSIFDSVSNGITIADARAPDLPLVYVNPAFERMTGFLAHEAYGRNCRFLQGSDTDQPGLVDLRKAIREKRAVRVLLKNYRKDGVHFWNELYLSPITDLEGRLTSFVGIQNDVTAQVVNAQQLEHVAHHDSLTGLANRGLLMEQLRQVLARARRGGENVAVLFLDIDNFKHMNDELGHDAGDRLLQIVAERLRSETRGGEMVARLGGDEFVVVLEGFSDEGRPHEVMRRLTSKVGQAVEFLEQQFYPSASVGIALFPRDSDTPEGLLKIADLNMYAAKHSARRASQSNEESLSKPT